MTLVCSSACRLFRIPFKLTFLARTPLTHVLMHTWDSTVAVSLRLASPVELGREQTEMPSCYRASSKSVR